MALTERSKVNLDLWNLFVAIVTLGQTYQVRIMNDFGFNRFQKSFFQKFDVKYVKVNLGSPFEENW